MAEGTSVEVEWQFEAPDLRAVERWLAAQPSHAAFALEREGERVQRDTYYDTPEWHLLHADYTVRVRERGGDTEITLKGTPVRRSGPVSRSEFTEKGTLPAILAGDGAVGARIALMARGAALRPLFTIVTARQTWRVRSGEATLAEVALDDTRIQVGAATVPLRRVEVEEVAPGGLRAIDALIEAARRDCGLTPALGGKFDAGMAAAGLRPGAPDLGPLVVAPEDRAVDRAYAVLRRQFGEFLAREGGTALGEDPEQLHQMRVATRRLRAGLRLFDQVIPAALVDSRVGFQWVAQALGAVRDLDVQIANLEDLRARADWAEATALAPLSAAFNGQRTIARSDLLTALNSDRYRALIVEFRSALVAGPGPDASGVPSRDEAQRVIWRRYRRFARDARMLRRDAPRTEYHALRIRGKRLRYSLEPFVDLFGRPGDRALRSLRAIQDLLGELQDLATTDARLRELVASRSAPLPVDTLVTIGRLMERNEARAREIVRAYPRARRAVLGNFDRLARLLRVRTPDPPEEAEEADADPAGLPLFELPLVPRSLRTATDEPRGVLGLLFRLARRRP